MNLKNLFVPLTKETFDDFSKGKVFELRKSERGWNRKQIVSGRGITLSCGYSGKRLYGKVGKVIFGNLETIFRKIPFKMIEPSTTSQKHAKLINFNQLGWAREYVAFEVILDRTQFLSF